MTNPVFSTLPDKLGEIRRRIADLEAKADDIRQKLIATGQSTITGDKFIATIRRTAFRELDPERLRKRISEDQLQRCLVEVEHVVVMVHARDEED